MRSLRSLIDPGGASLAYHVERLRRTLDELTVRLRAAVSQAVSEAVAGVAREAVHGLLAGDEERRGPDDYYPSRRPPRPPLWGVPEEDAYGLPRFADEEFEPPPRRAPAAELARRAAWPAAAAVGLRTAAWWLGRPGGKYRLLAAAGLGGVASLAVLAGGPLAVAGAGLAASVLGLAGLESVLRSACSALDALADP